MRHVLRNTLFTAGLLTFVGSTAYAAPKVRAHVVQHGDFVMVGNTLAQDCATGVPVPVAGTVGSCGTTGIDDNAPDVFWRSNDDGSAVANVSIKPSEARSAATLTVPAGATITHAYLYWAARAPSATTPTDTSVVLDRPGATGGFMQTVQAAEAYTVTVRTHPFYESVADVTNFVKAHGNGVYRVSDVLSYDVRNKDDDLSFAAWQLVVAYALPTLPKREIVLWDGLDATDIMNGVEVLVDLSGFTVPQHGPFKADFGIIAYDGDLAQDGDELRLVTGHPGGNQVSNALNPSGNFFNSTRSLFGKPWVAATDSPALTGTPGSMSGLDVDVIDVTDRLKPGQQTLQVKGFANDDIYMLGAYVMSIATYAPDMTTSTKQVQDLNGGEVQPGDALAYTVTVANSGTDNAVDVQLTDPLPSNVTFVPGSIRITAGYNNGAKTDAAGDDQCEYVAASRSVVCRLGNHATSAAGGVLKIGEQTSVRFEVKVNDDATGTVSNQATVSVSGEQGAPQQSTLTDGDSTKPGPQATVSTIVPCESDNDCTDGFRPWCLTTVDPNLCVACMKDGDCQGLTPTCDPTTHACVCVSSGAEVCGNLVDEDCDGHLDNGCKDSDGDGLGDKTEHNLGTDPNDADSDDDGVSDGQELLPGNDTDGDGLINALDPDSDNDGLFDGTERGFDCEGKDTDKSKNNCKPDADQGATKTDPLDADTDNGGVTDGSEDANLNGAVDSGETNPVRGHGADDQGVTDSDGDGLSDALEATLGTDPHDQDSDDDGLLDGQEANPSSDTDGDKKLNAMDPDSDGDGLFDGTEMGLGCDNKDTDSTKNQCIADGDQGNTTTALLVADTDHGGVADGTEDADHDGVVDSNERDPNDKTDDWDEVCGTDTDCDGADSGKICEDHLCVVGCRDKDGSRCPDPQHCEIPAGTEKGVCMNPSSDAGTADAGDQDAGDSTDGSVSNLDGGAGQDASTPQQQASDDGAMEGGGCACTVPGTSSSRRTGEGMAWISAAALAWMVSRRRRRS